MSMTGLEVFDTTCHKTNSWLKELMETLGWADRHRAYQVLRATLHALRDRMTVEEVAQLSAQLPMLVRGFYYEGWDPAGKPERIRHKDDFLAQVQQEFRFDDAFDPELAVRAVFGLLSHRINQGEIDDVKQLLPHEIRELWR
jgi:uncharacterized protein (DUF2267 family)